MESTRPQLVAARPAQTLEMVRNIAGDFDLDAFHAMEKRDETLIEQEILHGVGSDKFVYHFKIAGTDVSGISVVGARHLAHAYGGLKHRLVAAIQKTGSLFVFSTYPSENVPMQVTTKTLYELEEQPDFYGCLVELQDIKVGNSIQIERREERYGTRSEDGSQYERPNYATIAQSKAYRNAVCALIPQAVQIRWKNEMLKLKKGQDITNSVLAEKRETVLRFATQRAIPLQRLALEQLTMEQIAGLGDAARDGLPAFMNAARAVGLEVAVGPQAVAAEAASPPPPAEGGQPRRTRSRQQQPGPTDAGADTAHGSAAPAPQTSTATPASTPPAKPPINFEV